MGQLLITVGREFGSGGHEIAEKLAKRIGIAMYDKNMVDELSERYGFDKKMLSEHEESPVNVLFSRKIRGFSNSVEEVVAQREFEFIKEKADNGESFVIVGRCGEYVLRDYKNAYKIFIRGDESSKCTRIMERYNLNEQDAKERMKREDHQRRVYHNYYCDVKWGDSRNYDLCINSSVLGVDNTVELLYQYILKVTLMNNH